MTEERSSVSPELFEKKYARDDDPWNYAGSDYEAAKYRATLDSLPNVVYASALEIGCSIGVFTSMLAPRCRRLLAVDGSRRAIDHARRRCVEHDNVEFRTAWLPDAFPDRRFDLVVLSEVGYYWSAEDLERVRDQIVEHLVPGGNLILVHWTPDIDDAPLTGDVVHDTFITTSGLRHVSGLRERTYRIDLFEHDRTV